MRVGRQCARAAAPRAVAGNAPPRQLGGPTTSLDPPGDFSLARSTARRKRFLSSFFPVGAVPNDELGHRLGPFQALPRYSAVTTPASAHAAPAMSLPSPTVHCTSSSRPTDSHCTVAPGPLERRTHPLHSGHAANPLTTTLRATRCAQPEGPGPGRLRGHRKPFNGLTNYHQSQHWVSIGPDKAGGYRRRDQARNNQPGERGAARSASAHQAAGAGERGPAPGRGLPVAGEPPGKRIYPLVKELATDGIPVTVTCRVLKLARQPYYR